MPQTLRPAKIDLGIDHSGLIQPFTPEKQIVDSVVSIICRAGADIGDVEYLMDQNTGTPCFDDFKQFIVRIESNP